MMGSVESCLLYNSDQVLPLKEIRPLEILFPFPERLKL